MINIIAKKIEANSDGEGSYYFKKVDIENYPTIQLMGTLETGETIPLMYLGSDQETLTPVTDDDNEELSLSATNTAIPIKRAMQIKLVKGITTNAVGVDIAGVY